MRFLWSHNRLLLNPQDMKEHSAGPMLIWSDSIGPPLEQI
jgi:hypothetical protein